LVSANARPEDVTLGVFGGGDVLLDGKRREDLVVVGVPAGRAYGLITLNWSAWSSDGTTMLADDIRGVPPEIVQRFRLPPSGRSMPPSSGSMGRDPTFVVGPSVIVTAHARKGDRTVTLDVAVRGRIEHHATPVVIEANALTPASVPIRIEALFTRAGALVFDDIAAADIDGNGVIDSEDLGQSSGTCADDDPWPSDRGGDEKDGDEECEDPSIVDTLESRVPDIIGLPVESRDDRAPVFERSASLASGRQTRHAALP
jgi:hypothetical protein